MLLSRSSSEACASRDHFFFLFFLSQDFYEFWCCVLIICLFTEVKQQLATLVLDGRQLRCTIHVYDGFAARTSISKHVLALFLKGSQLSAPST